MTKDDQEKLLAISIASALAIIASAIYMTVTYQNHEPLQPECQDIYQLTTKEVLSCE